MFHVVTVHWNSEEWIDPQHQLFGRFFPGDTRVYASLNGVRPERFPEFYFAEDLKGSHPEKLDLLASVVSENASPDDVLIFIDGDALPIAPISSEFLDGHPLAAIRRDENLGEPYPHPAFCMTTVGFWNDLGTDWEAGPEWTNAQGHRISDAGCRLWAELDRRQVGWKPLLRTNAYNLHPLWFGVYADAVYHHGAGFRDRVDHVDATKRKTMSPSAGARMVRTPAYVPLLPRVERSLRWRLAGRRRLKFSEDGRAERLSQEVYESILATPDFYRRFTLPVKSQ